MSPAARLRSDWLAVLVLGVAGLFALAFAAKVSLQMGLAWRCPVLSLLSIPCPSCGSTRAFAALAEGQIFGALRFNPLLVLGAPLGLLAWSMRNRLTRTSWGWPFFFGLVFANWFYLLLFLPR